MFVILRFIFLILVVSLVPYGSFALTFIRLVSSVVYFTADTERWSCSRAECILKMSQRSKPCTVCIFNIGRRIFSSCDAYVSWNLLPPAMLEREHCRLQWHHSLCLSVSSLFFLSCMSLCLPCCWL